MYYLEGRSSNPLVCMNFIFMLSFLIVSVKPSTYGKLDFYFYGKVAKRKGKF